MKTTIAIIIGNGFDIDMGLPSSYPEFANSDEWKNLFNSFWGNRWTNWGMDYSLLWYLKKAIRPNWFEIEEEIREFASAHPILSEKQERIIHKEFEGLRQALSSYLVRISKDYKADERKLAYQLLTHLPKYPGPIIEIFFNYTNPDLFLKKPLKFASVFHCTYTYVHGNLEENNIVLGCDISEREKVNRSLSFMYKYNMLTKANQVVRNLLEAREVIFFGHSVNEMDFCYFKDFFKSASSSPTPFRYVTFITWDEKSERDIKDNIRNQGISVTDLYNNLFSLDFIHSSKVYESDETEIQKWKDLLNRLLIEDRHEL